MAQRESQLKKISPASIPRAISKAQRYRLLNEPRESESICRDILAVDKDNQEVIVTLLLSITDQFPQMAASVDKANEVLGWLTGAFERAYYGGVIAERWGKAMHEAGYTCGDVHELFDRAMSLYDEAQSLAPSGNEDAVLRWNACARVIDRYDLHPTDAEADIEMEAFEDEVPYREA
jgi:hypothetical protein